MWNIPPHIHRAAGNVRGNNWGKMLKAPPPRLSGLHRSPERLIQKFEFFFLTFRGSKNYKKKCLVLCITTTFFYSSRDKGLPISSWTNKKSSNGSPKQACVTGSQIIFRDPARTHTYGNLFPHYHLNFPPRKQIPWTKT